MILLWGLSGDGPLRAVSCALERQGLSTFFLDQHAILDTSLELFTGAEVSGTLRVRSSLLDLESITAAYLRPYDFRQLPAIQRAGSRSPAWQHALSIDEGMQAWAEVTPAFVVNRPSAMASNGSKPYQAALIRAAGLEIPETLVTTDAEAVMEFWARHQSLIYKSTSGIRSIVSKLTPEHCERLKDIASCPTQFQEYIKGTDYRVHVVGDEVFASEIVTAADDYRYAGQNGMDVEIRACELDSALRDKCRKLADSLSLPVAGIDLRRTPGGRWYCFEVNPSPGFTYYQQSTGQPIGDSIVSLMASAELPRRTDGDVTMLYA